MVGSKMRQILHRILRPAFGLALFGSQFTSRRGAFFTGAMRRLTRPPS